MKRATLLMLGVMAVTATPAAADPPIPVGFTPQNNAVVRGSVTVSWSIPGNASSASLYVDDMTTPLQTRSGLPPSTHSGSFSPYDTDGLGQTAHTFKVSVTADIPTLATTHTVYVDRTPPRATITAPQPNALTNDATPTITFDAADDQAAQHAPSISCRLGTQPAVACAPPSFTPTAALGDGEHTFFLSISDGVNSASDNRTLIVDTVAPTVTYTGGVPEGAATASTTASFTFTAADPNGIATRQCSIDSATVFVDCASGSYITPRLADGPHTVRVRATDRAGNQAVSPRTFTVDTSSPETTITGGPGEGATVTGPSPPMTFAASVAGSTFSCRVYTSGLPAPAFGACSGPGAQHSLAGLAAGSYTFEVYATNPLGTPDRTPAVRHLTLAAPPSSIIVTTPPSSVIVPVPSAPAVTQVSFRYSAHWRFVGKRTHLTLLRVNGLRAGAVLTVTCRGGGCPLKSKAFTSKGKPIDLIKRFRKALLKPRVVVELRGTAPGRIGWVEHFAFRSHKDPVITDLCLPPGAKRPRKHC